MSVQRATGLVVASALALSLVSAGLVVACYYEGPVRGMHVSPDVTSPLRVIVIALVTLGLGCALAALARSPLAVVGGALIASGGVGNWIGSYAYKLVIWYDQGLPSWWRDAVPNYLPLPLGSASLPDVLLWVGLVVGAVAALQVARRSGMPIGVRRATSGPTSSRPT